MANKEQAKGPKRATAAAKPGTPEHEEAVKGLLRANLEKTLETLQQLDVLEAKQLEIGNAFLAFRFNVAGEATPSVKGQG